MRPCTWIMQKATLPLPPRHGFPRACCSAISWKRENEDHPKTRHMTSCPCFCWSSCQKKIEFQKAACNQHCLARAGFPILGCHLGGRRTLIESSTCLTPGTLRAAPSSCCRQFCKDEGIFISHISCNHFCHFVSGMYLNPHWTGGGPNGQCLLVRNEFIFQKQLWTFGSCKIYILIFLKYTCRELYCLEHGIHPDGMIPPVSRLLSNTTSWNIVRKRTTVN